MKQQQLAALTWSVDAHARRDWLAMPPNYRGLAAVWYYEAHLAARRMYHDVGVAADVIALLSPRNKWSSNLEDAANLLSGKTEVSYAAFGTMIQKAQHRRDGLPLDSVLKGPARKVRSFSCNIKHLSACPHEKPCVTVDTWMLRWHGLDERATEKKGVYDAFAQGIRNAARKVGVYPFQMQASLWVPQTVGGG